MESITAKVEELEEHAKESTFPHIDYVGVKNQVYVLAYAEDINERLNYAP